LILDSNWNNPNRWFKVVIVNCQILTTQGYLSWPLWGSVEAAVIQSAKKNYIGVWSSIRPSCWCIVCLIWLGDEALNALKIWPSEQLSSGKERRWWIVTRRQVVSFVPFSFYCSVKTCCFI
jgi:hypothetical protein